MASPSSSDLDGALDCEYHLVDPLQRTKKKALFKLASPLGSCSPSGQGSAGGQRTGRFLVAMNCAMASITRGFE
jgi:hypothetical protein